VDADCRSFPERREPRRDTLTWGLAACGHSVDALAWCLSESNRIPLRSPWSWKARPQAQHVLSADVSPCTVTVNMAGACSTFRRTVARLSCIFGSGSSVAPILTADAASLRSSSPVSSGLMSAVANGSTDSRRIPRKRLTTFNLNVVTNVSGHWAGGAIRSFIMKKEVQYEQMTRDL
jgi:hypothetical protein